MKTPYDIIYTHVAKTLPENLAERRELLQALHDAITDKNKIKPIVAAQIASIDALKNMQTEFIGLLE